MVAIQTLIHRIFFEVFLVIKKDNMLISELQRFCGLIFNRQEFQTFAPMCSSQVPTFMSIIHFVTEQIKLTVLQNQQRLLKVEPKAAVCGCVCY